MKKTSIVLHQNYLDDVIKSLHETGLMQIIDISKEEPDILKETEICETDSEAETLANYEIRLTRLIDILKKVKPKKSGIKSILNPELPEIKTVEDNALDELYSYAEGVLDEIENSILEKQKNLEKLSEKKENIKNQLEQVEYLKDFDFDISNIKQSEYLIIKAGLTSDFKEIKKQIQDLGTAEIYEKSFKIGKKIVHSVVIISHISNKEKIEKLSRTYLEEFSLYNLSGNPAEITKLLNQNIKDVKNEREKLISGLKKYSKKQLDELFSIREEIQLEKARREIPRNFTMTNYTYLVKGWVLEKNQDDLNDLIKVITKNKAIIDFKTPSKNPDNPPTYIKTPKWAEGFKGLVEMFSMPKYGEINPTIIMGIFFVLFFGVMLGDAGYGLVILILSLFGYFKLGKHSTMFRNWSFMGIWMGVVTFVFGFLTNSFFGNLAPLFIYGNEGALLYDFHLFGFHIKPIVDPINDPITILVLALVLGLIQLNLGIFLGLIQTIKDKKYKELLTGKSCWIPLQLGGGILIGSSILGFTFSQPVMYLGIIFAIIGFIQLLISAGPVGFFDITGYVGDWLSYARLLALGLATAGMALAFNVVSKLFNEMMPLWMIFIIIMLVFFILLKLLKLLSKQVFVIWLLITLSITIAIFILPDLFSNSILEMIIVGMFLVIVLSIIHLINLGLQALGAGIHSLRLQYVEFFNRFYEGGGKEFSPFKIKRKYTKLKDETE